MSQSPQPPAEPVGSPPGMEAPLDLTGKTLGDFKLLRRLGQGGMGQVYVAEQISLKRKVAVKILKSELAASPSSLKRFRAEAEVVARATHANIVQVYAISEANGLHYMVLEYVEGTNLRDYLNKKGPPEVPLALSIMRQVAAALARAGELGITHRDIKPENILLTKKAEVKVADFGLSRDDRQPLNITQTGVTMGTPLYMSPEQVQGKPVDPRSDIYSFGVTCFHLLSGNPPFRGQNAFEVAMHHVQTEPPPLYSIRPDLPADLCAVVDRMMAKDPEARFQTGREVLRELNRLRDMLSGITQAQAVGQSAAALGSGSAPTLAAARPSSTSMPALPPRRGGRYVLVTLSLLFALAAGATLAFFQSRASVAPAGSTATLELERSLRRHIKDLASPGDDPRRLEQGMRAHLNLGLLLIEENRLKEAGDLFHRLTEDAQPEYRDVGKLGQAIVLAHQDQAGPSTQLFQEWLKSQENGKLASVWNTPRLRFVIARAIDRNAALSEPTKEPLPPELDRLRQPSALFGRLPRDKSSK